ncbi:MAG: S8 family serine peptidase, partial [Planctomycetota bacterium]|nr:S8 family serine peptidase [Planctomycetota bacterium]
VEVAPGTRIETIVASLAAQQTIDFASPVFHSLPLGPKGQTYPIFPTRDLIVGFAPGTAPAQRDAVLAANSVVAGGNGTLVERNWAGMDGVDLTTAASKNGFEVLTQANTIAQRADVVFAEPDMMITGMGGLIPNDPFFPNLWGINNTGQSGGVADADMNGPEAWDITTGSASVTVAIFDIGVQLNHPDIGMAAVSADFTGTGGGGAPGNACDNHGTACASCVSGIINNGIGITGIAPGCRTASARIGVSIIPCDGRWNGALSNTVNALAWCQTNGYRVTSNSNSYGGTSAAVDTAYTNAKTAGIVHFASSGNSGAGSIAYPASSPSVNAVGAINNTGALTSFSQFGTGQKFASPGQGIYAADRTGADGYLNGDYVIIDGTSFSCPYTAGVAALVISRNGSLSAAQVENIMYSTAKDRGTAGYDTVYGFGIPDARAALIAAAPPPANDACANAIALASDTTVNGTLDNATFSAGDGSTTCSGGTSQPDVWYSFTAPAQMGGTLTVSTCGTHDAPGVDLGIDTVLTVLSGCGGSLLTCNDDTASCGALDTGNSRRDSAVSLTLTPGQSVRVRVSRYNSTGGAFRVNTTFRLTNDSCSNAINISSATSAGLTLQGTLVGATNDGTSPCGNSAGNGDVWYRFTSAACSPGRLRVTTCGSNDANGLDTVMSLHNNCGEAPFVCIDDGSQSGVANCGAQDTGLIRDSVLETVVIPGQTVYVRVAKFSGSAPNSFFLNAFFTTPANDACANAVAITDGTYNFCTTGATTDPATGGPTESFCSGAGDPNIGSDLWYSYVAPCDGTASVVLCGSNFDTKVGAYAGTCPTAANTVITCNDDSCGLQSQISFPATAGQNYLIRIGGYLGAVGNVTMTIGTQCSFVCPADFNQDGGVDGADVDAFFAAWEAGEATADVNQDGGVDGSDINVFFAAWEAGGC